MNINEFCKSIEQFGTNIGKFCVDNGIQILDRKFNVTDIDVILYVSVIRNNRTDEEIEMLVRQLKVMFLIPFPQAGLRVKYKVV